MKKSIGKKIIAFAIIVPIFVTMAYAAVGKKQLEASYNNIKLVIDGTVIMPKDAAGTVVEPFIVSGTTYLPVRAVAEALGKDVSWNGDTQTVTISTPKIINGIQVYDDEYVTIRFVGCRAEELYSRTDYLAEFNVTNKTDVELTDRKSVV